MLPSHLGMWSWGCCFPLFVLNCSIFAILLRLYFFSFFCILFKVLFLTFFNIFHINYRSFLENDDEKIDSLSGWDTKFHHFHLHLVEHVYILCIKHFLEEKKCFASGKHVFIIPQLSSLTHVHNLFLPEEYA